LCCEPNGIVSYSYLVVASGIAPGWWRAENPLRAMAADAKAAAIICTLVTRHTQLTTAPVWTDL
jgi:hypothetical protein